MTIKPFFQFIQENNQSLTRTEQKLLDRLSNSRRNVAGVSGIREVKAARKLQEKGLIARYVPDHDRLTRHGKTTMYYIGSIFGFNAR